MTLSAEQEAEILEQLVKYNVHIGSRIKVKHMESFIFRMRYDGVYLFDVKKILERLNLAAKLISYYPANEVVAVSTHVFGMRSVTKFAELTGAVAVAGKMMAGVLTNRTLKNYMEPSLVIISDPRYDVQALEEAAIARIPVIAMCSTDNTCSNVDLVIPMNNRSRTSLPYAFWYLTRRVLEERGQLTPDFDAIVKPEDFMALPTAAEIE
ncbi:MAG: 30S ribosomal protein S2 [Candidatus Caldarchaeum sp.]